MRLLSQLARAGDAQCPSVSRQKNLRLNQAFQTACTSSILVGGMLLVGPSNDYLHGNWSSCRRTRTVNSARPSSRRAAVRPAPSSPHSQPRRPRRRSSASRASRRRARDPSARRTPHGAGKTAIAAASGSDWCSKNASRSPGCTSRSTCNDPQRTVNVAVPRRCPYLAALPCTETGPDVAGWPKSPHNREGPRDGGPFGSCR